MLAARMRALVTGGHGFIGSHLVRRLLDGGTAVRCLYRRPGFPAVLAGLDVEVVRGDVRDPAGLAAAVAGVDEVHHLAGLTSSLTRRAMMRTNADGTRNLLDAAEQAGGVRRFVLCSSLAAVGPAPDGEALVESAPARPLTWYGASKLAAEEFVLARRERLPVTVLRPPAVYGPGDLAFLPFFRSAALGLTLVPGAPSKRYHMAYVEDLADALVAAAGSPATVGRVFFAAHPVPVTLAELIGAAEAAVGHRSLHLELPASFLRLTGRVTDLLSQLTGDPSMLGSQRMRELVVGDWVCSSRAIQEATGWRAAVGLEEGFRKTVAWYRERRLLR